MDTRTLLVIIKDAVLMAVGVIGILHQEFAADKVEPALLAVYTAILGVPTVTNVVALLRSGAPSSSSADPDSPPVSSGSSPRSSNGRVRDP